MGNACHCVNEKDQGNTMNLAPVQVSEHNEKIKGKALQEARDDESNVGDAALEAEFDPNDPEMQNAAIKLQV